ncbi:hypothetical protein LCGC14_2432990, partial [marine sediment metagenome]
ADTTATVADTTATNVNIFSIIANTVAKIANAAAAAAKAVAGVPFIGPILAIAAAASIITGLKYLISGFDVRANDITAFGWGQDAGNSFMSGFASVTSAPGFGEAVIGNMKGGPGAIPGGGATGGGAIVIHQTIELNNAIFTDTAQISELSEQMESASYEGLSRAVFRPARQTGGPSESFRAPTSRRPRDLKTERAGIGGLV